MTKRAWLVSGAACAALLIVVVTGRPDRLGAPAARLASRAALPLSFERNRGQAPRGFDFLAHSADATLGLGRGRVRLALGAKQRLGLVPVGGRLGRPTPVTPLPGQVNYLVGSDRSRWIRHVPTFGRVRYAGVWPGIDLTFHGTRGTLEYDLDVAAGADPRAIELALPGARGVTTDGAGGVRAGAVHLEAPTSWQTAGDGRRLPVPSRLVTDGGHVRVSLGHYDHARPLVIDPTVVFSTYVGGKTAVATDVATDAQGNVYVAGTAQSGADLATTSGAYQTAFRGGAFDAFVEKLDPTGSHVVYATYLGSDQIDQALSLAVTSTGEAYVGGITQGGTAAAKFPIVTGAYQAAYGGGSFDGFVSALSADGSALSASTFLGGTTNNDAVYGLATAPGGDVVLTGNFAGVNGCLDPLSNTSGPATVRMNASLTAAPYFTCVLGAQGSAVAVDPSGNAYVAAGGLNKAFTQMTTTAGAVQSARIGADNESNGAVYKLSAGGGIQYATYVAGGTGAQSGSSGIAVDAAGDAYVSGNVRAGWTPPAGAFQPASGGVLNAFAIKLNPSATAYVFGTYLGGTYTAGHKIALDAAGHAWVSTTSGAGGGFPVTPDAVQAANAGAGDATLTEFAADGASLLYSTYLGGPGTDEGADVEVAPNGTVLLAGSDTQAFPVTAGAADNSTGKGSYVAAFDPGTAPTATPAPGGGTATATPGIFVTPSPTPAVQSPEPLDPTTDLNRLLYGALTKKTAQDLGDGERFQFIELSEEPGDSEVSGDAGEPAAGRSLASTAKKRRPRKVTLFRVRHHFAAAGKAKVTVRISKQGRKLLLRAYRAQRKVKVTLTASFTPIGKATFTHRRTATLKPGKKKRKH